jgi:hypothetical protein
MNMLGAESAADVRRLGVITAHLTTTTGARLRMRQRRESTSSAADALDAAAPPPPSPNATSGALGMLDITKRSDTVLGQSGVQVAYDVLELEHNRAPSKGTVVLLHGAGINNPQGRH